MINIYQTEYVWHKSLTGQIDKFDEWLSKFSPLAFFFNMKPTYNQHQILLNPFIKIFALYSLHHMVTGVKYSLSL